MANLADLVIKVTSDVQGVRTGMADTRSELQKTQREAEQTGRAMRGLGDHMNTAANGALAAGTALALGLGQATKTTIAYGQSIDDVSDISNLGAEAASKLTGQMQYFDLSAQSAANGVKFFEKNLDAARQGNDEMAEAFARLGISADELQKFSDAELLFKTRDAMSELGDKTARTAITLQLFGRSGADLSDWLDAAPSDIAEVNKLLEQSGLIWDGKAIDSWQDMIDAQREMRISMLGLQVAIADPGFVGSISALVREFTDFLQTIRPLMPALPYITAGLFVFGGTVKAISMVQFIRDLGVTGDRLSTVGKATRTGVKAMGAWIAKVPALVAANAALIGSFAAVAIGIYAIVKAYQAWQEAAAQAAAAAAGAQANLDANASKLDPAFVAQKQADIQRDAYQSPEGIGGWLQALIDGQIERGMLSWMQFLPHFADGGIASAPATGGLAVLHGVEKVAPLESAKAGGKEAGRGDVVFKDCTFSARSPRELMDLMKRELARDVRYANG